LTAAAVELLKKRGVISVDLTSDADEMPQISSPKKVAPPEAVVSATQQALPADVQWILDWALRCSPESRAALKVSED
jgi:hypothetical protein